MRRWNDGRRRIWAVPALPDSLVSHWFRGYSYLYRLMQPPGVERAWMRLCISLGAAGVAFAALLIAAVLND